MSDNRRIATEAYERVIMALDSSQVDRYFSPHYIQHSSLAADGVAALKAFLDQARRDHPQLRTQIRRVLADGDHVMFHVHTILEPGDAGFAVVDIFRMKDGKVAEHWDVIQPVPHEPSNPNGMF